MQHLLEDPFATPVVLTTSSEQCCASLHPWAKSEKKDEIILWNGTAEQGKNPIPPAASHLPYLLDQLEDKLGDYRLAGVHLFALSCQEFNFSTWHATNTSVSLQLNMHFAGMFYISLKSHLLSQYRMLLICSKALKCNEKGIIVIEKWAVDQHPTDIPILPHHWKQQYCKSKPLTSLPYRKKYLA